jgi:hypothetical protein
MTGLGGTCLQSWLLRRQRQENLEFEVSWCKVIETLSESQNENKWANGIA